MGTTGRSTVTVRPGEARRQSSAICSTAASWVAYRNSLSGRSTRVLGERHGIVLPGAVHHRRGDHDEVCGTAESSEQLGRPGGDALASPGAGVRIGPAGVDRDVGVAERCVVEVGQQREPAEHTGAEGALRVAQPTPRSSSSLPVSRSAIVGHLRPSSSAVGSASDPAATFDHPRATSAHTASVVPRAR